MVNRVVSIIVKSSDAGGNVADVLAMVSHDAKETQLTEDERKIAMSTYIAVIYISFFVFLVTIWILNVTFLPQIRLSGTQLETQLANSATTAGGQVQSPLAANIEQVILGLQIAFFIAAVVHALGDGILAGVLDNGHVANGLRHSFIMLVIAIISFQFI